MKHFKMYTEIDNETLFNGFSVKMSRVERDVYIVIVKRSIRSCVRFLTLDINVLFELSGTVSLFLCDEI